jgi:signal transduction histidine kinase
VYVLSHAFDTMAERVASHQRSMEKHAGEVEEALDRLTAVNSLKDEFISVLSHEFRTPLTSIRLFAEVLRTSPDLSEAETHEFLQIIEAECDRMARLSNDLLDLAKIESDEITWRNEPFEITSVIDTVVQSTSLIASAKKVTVVKEEGPDLPSLYADRDRITQLVTNLVSNALRFTPEDGKITICATAEDFEGELNLRLSVRDTGPGIPDDLLDTIFDHFVQAHDSGTRDGTGLGLAICQRIVRHYKGSVTASNIEGGGAAFDVVLRTATAEQIAAGPDYPDYPDDTDREDDEDSSEGAVSGRPLAAAE